MTRRVKSDGIQLREVRVRTVRPDGEPRWNALMRDHQYLGVGNFCGQPTCTAPPATAHLKWPRFGDT